MAKLTTDEKFKTISKETIHRLVYKLLGRPMKCEHCGIKYAGPRGIHWANKSQKYLNDTNDWLRLCYLCHGVYDNRFIDSPKYMVYVKKRTRMGEINALKKKAINLYSNGLTTREVGEILGKSHNWVAEAVKMNDIEVVKKRATDDTRK